MAGSSFKDRPMITADFHPCIWGDYFLQHSPDFMNNVTKKEYDELKEEVRRILNNTTGDNLLEKLHLYDVVQLLGVGYHFEKELSDALETIYKDAGIHDSDDLYTIALWFRLLRQEGINASTDVFNKFVDEKGKFKAELANDALGMLSLYEAAHLSLPGEDILDDAIAFTVPNLESILSTDHSLTPKIREQITYALNRCLRKNLPRLVARHYISLCSKYDDNHLPSHGALLKFAKLDFNMVQAIHQKELRNITEWWKKLDLKTKLPFARDRLVECYFWMMEVTFEPQYSVARIFSAKILKMTSVFDDIFDNYGTYDELKELTNCVERWDIDVIEQLPDYMKCPYEALLDIYTEVEVEVAKQGRLFALHYAKESFKQLIKAYFVEAKWREEGRIPPVEEYMKNALVSSTYEMLTPNSYVGMEIATKEAFDWISSNPSMLVACTTICRVMDDIITHQFERERIHVYSAVESYIKEHNVSREEAVKHFRKQVSEAWKGINEGCMKPRPFPMILHRNIINLVRAIDVVYRDADAYTNSYLLKDHIASLLVDPFPL